MKYLVRPSRFILPGLFLLISTPFSGATGAVAGSLATARSENYGSGTGMSTKLHAKSNHATLESLRPTWSMELQGSLDAFGKKSISPNDPDLQSRAFIVEFQYEPRFLQHFGTFSFGPSIGLYPSNGSLGTQNGTPGAQNNAATTGTAATTGSVNSASTGAVTTPGTATPKPIAVGDAVESPLDLFHYGFKAQYQMDYWERQWLVPYVSYNFYQFHYRFSDERSGNVPLSGGSVGLNFPLTRLEEDSGRRFAEQYGVKKASLNVEGKFMSGGDENIDVSGVSYFMGLKLDW